MYKINIKTKTGRIKIILFNNSEMRQKKSFVFKTYFIFGVFFAMAFAAENKYNGSIYLSESEINYCENDVTQFNSVEGKHILVIPSNVSFKSIIYLLVPINIDLNYCSYHHFYR